MSEQSKYEELMKKHNIVTIMGGSDLAIDPATGDLLMGKRGSIMWQGKAHNAMFQFVREFEMIFPKLKAQFTDIVESHAEEAALVEISNKHAEKIAQQMRNNEPVDSLQIHKLSDKQGAIQTGREVNAATIFITLNVMLQSLKDELGVDKNKFLQSAPLHNGQSFGNIVWAASNNARHGDEWKLHWVANKKFSPQQLSSVRVLAPVLGHAEKDYRFLASKVCAKILKVISNDDFETLERALFIFANNLADGVENNKTVRQKQSP